MVNKKQLFIIGNPRSGTSLLRIMLNSHSSIVVPPECGFIQWWHQKYKDWPSNFSIYDFVTDLQTSKKIETWEIDFEILVYFLEQSNSKSYGELMFNVIDFYGRSKHQKINSEVLGDKNNYYIEHLDLLRRISPTAKFLIILRDPRDVYCSYKGIAELKSTSTYIPKLSQSLESFLRDWRHNHSKILKFLQIIDANQFTVINYEDLVLETKTELVKVCDFLELSFDENMLKYYKTNDEPKALLDWKKKTLQPPDSSSIGSYKKLLFQSEVKKIESDTFELYKQLKQSIS